jgi:hypothetical protein
MLNFILSKLAVWGLLGVPFFLVARWIFRANSAQLNVITYFIIIYLVLIVLQGWIEDWNAVCAQREVQIKEGPRSSKGQTRRLRLNDARNEEGFAVADRDWQMPNRRRDPL